VIVTAPGALQESRTVPPRDQKIVDWLITEFKTKNNIDLSKDKMALQRLKDAAEKAKIELSQMMETEVNLPFITAGANGPIHMEEKLTRTRLEQMMMICWSAR